MHDDPFDDDTTETSIERNVNNYLPARRFEVELMSNYARDRYVSLSREEFRILNAFLDKYQENLPTQPEVYRGLPDKVQKVLHNWMQMRVY